MRAQRKTQSKRDSSSIARAVLEVLEARRLMSASTWTGTGGNSLWSNANNWSGGAVPASGADVFFPSNVSYSALTVNANAAEIVNSLTIINL